MISKKIIYGVITEDDNCGIWIVRKNRRSLWLQNVFREMKNKEVTITIEEGSK